MNSEESFSAIVNLRIEKSAETEGDAEEFVGFFEGVASTPIHDLEGDRFSEEALKRSAEKLVEKPIMLLHGRDPSVGPVAVGRILEARYVDGALRIRAGIYKAFEEIWRKVKNGVLKALSIGGLIKRFRKLPSGGREILDAEILEVSLTPRGVNPEARVIHVFGKSYLVEDGVLTSLADGGFEAEVARLRAEIAELRRIVEPLMIEKGLAGAERRPKALVSGLYDQRRMMVGETLLTPAFDELWGRIVARRASQSYKNSGG